MNATRNQNGSTNENLSALLEFISRDESDVRLFATRAEISGESDDGGHVEISSNLPLVAAVVHDHRRWIVFDGNLLTATRSPRRAEVVELLDAAVADGNVLFGTVPVDFTSSMTADKAARYLANIPTSVLTSDSRKDYARMLTSFDPESL